MDRLLDLANIIKRANSFVEISEALAREKETLKVICEGKASDGSN